VDEKVPTQHTHWIETLANNITSSKTGPYVVSAGITTSGPCHLGTLCEFLFPAAIHKQLVLAGHKAKFYFIADILDAFDSIPLIFSEYENTLKPHLGKPLCYVPDPEGCHPSFGDHFLAEIKNVMVKFQIRPEILKASELYASGSFDKLAAFFLENQKRTSVVVAESSLRESMPPDWSAIMPICEKCGRIATTITTSYDKNTQIYTYSDSRDVGYTKGCGWSGSNKLSDHKYKLTWRLHWPSWMEVLGTSIEGAGMDHHTKGGSWDTLAAVYKNLFNKQPPIGFKFGFILFQGKKYSKSKGIGMGLSELLEILPPELIAFSLLRPDLQENIDINPTTQNLLKLISDYTKAMADSSKDLSSLERAPRKAALAAKISSPNGIRWRTQFTDILLYFELYRNWGVVANMLDDSAGVAYLKPYVLAWVERKLAPPEYVFELSFSKLSSTTSKSFVQSLKPGASPEEIHNFVFECAKLHHIQPADLFKELYTHIIGKQSGPKLGKLIHAIGVETIKRELL